MTTTDEKKIEVVEARSHLNEQYLKYKTEKLNVVLHHLTRGKKEHTPICDEIRVMIDNNRYYVLFGVEYDDKGYVAMLYKADENGKRTPIPISKEIKTTAKSRLINERIDEAKKATKHPKAKTEEKAPTKTKTTKRMAKNNTAIMQSERLN